MLSASLNKIFPSFLLEVSMREERMFCIFQVLVESTDDTGLDAVAKSLTVGLAGIGFTSRYWLQPRTGF